MGWEEGQLWNSSLHSCCPPAFRSVKICLSLVYLPSLRTRAGSFCGSAWQAQQPARQGIGRRLSVFRNSSATGCIHLPTQSRGSLFPPSLLLPVQGTLYLLPLSQARPVLVCLQRCK